MLLLLLSPAKTINAGAKVVAGAQLAVQPPAGGYHVPRACAGGHRRVGVTTAAAAVRSAAAAVRSAAAGRVRARRRRGRSAAAGLRRSGWPGGREGVWRRFQVDGFIRQRLTPYYSHANLWDPSLAADSEYDAQWRVSTILAQTGHKKPGAHTT